MVVGLVLAIVGLFGLFSSNYGFGGMMGGMIGGMMGSWSPNAVFGGVYSYLGFLPLVVSTVVTALGILIVLDAVKKTY